MKKCFQNTRTIKNKEISINWIFMKSQFTIIP